MSSLKFLSEDKIIPTKNNKIIYDFISLYEFMLISGLSLTAIAGKNLFLGIFVIFLFSKQIPERILKHLTKDKLGKRPTNAKNCNMINKGGKSSDKPGFPSGHTTVASFVFFYTLLEYIRIKKDTGKQLNELLSISILFLVLIPIARVKSGCHTTPQVLGGFFLGMLWAYLFYTLENNYLIKINRYKKDKQKVYDFLINKY